MQPNANRLSTSAKTVPSKPEPLELYYSKGWTIFRLLFISLWTLLVAYTCFGLSGAIGPPLAALLFAPWPLFFLWTVWGCRAALMWVGPVIVLDEYGIADFREGQRSASWIDITHVRFEVGDASCSLVVRFRDLAAATQHTGRLGLIPAVLNRISTGGHWSIGLADIKYRRTVVMRTALAFLDQAHTGARPAPDQSSAGASPRAIDKTQD